ncbi:MAG: AAA family ATPase [Flavobacteriaceae bacterium]|nr:AAA family ATPase [Flavobacteriaceae bacterium]
MRESTMSFQHIDDIDDRGSADYFHGRHDEIGFFKSSLETSKRKGKAKSILIQGPPGVGKTALKQELKKIAQPNWKVIEIESIHQLSDPFGLGVLLLGRKKFQRVAQEIGLDLKILKGKIEYQKIKDDVFQILSLATKPILLVLDEAQIIGNEFSDHQTSISPISFVMKAIHNLEGHHGFVTLFTGLGNTRKLYHDFNISRFHSNAVINLQPLDPTSEKAILKDYLVKDAKLDPNHSDLDDFIQTISKETHQWPHHIICYAQTASKLIQHHGVLSENVWNETLERGRRLKDQYYQGRFDGITAEIRCSIYHALLENEIQKNQIRSLQLIESLTLNPYIKDPQTTWDRLIAKGIVQVGNNGFYQIPIPSMRTWMIKKYQQYHQALGMKPSTKMQQIIQSLNTPNIDNHPKI